MQGKSNVIAALNDLLALELSAVNQYIVHSEMCSNWGYHTLAGYIKGRAIAEMKHAEKLIERILFLEGRPAVGAAPRVNIASSVEQMFPNDGTAELTAIAAYTKAIELCQAEGDSGTRLVLEPIVADENEHLNGIEERQAQINQMGIANFLSTSV